MPETVPEHGPFRTERQARETAAVQAVYAAFEADDLARMMPRNLAVLAAACEAAGVDLGEYDEQILCWLANYEPEMCAVVAGIIRRAAEHRTADQLRAHLDADHAAIAKLGQINEALTALADTALELLERQIRHPAAVRALRESREKARLAIQEAGAGLNRCWQEGETDG